MTTERRKMSVANVLALVSMMGAVLTVWWNVSADAADTKRRVSTLESRQVEDRADAQTVQKELKSDVKRIDSNVQKVLGHLEAMENRQVPTRLGRP